MLQNPEKEISEAYLLYIGLCDYHFPVKAGIDKTGICLAFLEKTRFAIALPMSFTALMLFLQLT